MSEGENDYQWFVEPQDDFTNGVIFDLLQHFGMDEDCGSFKCADGEDRLLWRCDRRVINHLKKSYTHTNYKVWCREGQGQIRPSFLDQKKPRKTRSQPVHAKPNF